MGKNRLFKNGKIASEDSIDLLNKDVFVNSEGLIQNIGIDLDISNDTEIIDCQGCVLVPGMFDMNVQSCEPSYQHKETIESCSLAALHGGVTSIALIPNCSNPITTGSMIKNMRDLLSYDNKIDIFPVGSLIKSLNDFEIADYGSMFQESVIFLSNYNQNINSLDLLRGCIEYANDFNILVALKPSNILNKNKGVINRGKISYRLGLSSIDSIDEEFISYLSTRVAKEIKSRIHLHQISTKEAVDIVRRSKKNNIKVTCEVSHHHLILSEDDILGYDSNYKLDPPLRSYLDKEALIQGLLDDTIDVITSNHSPHTEFEKLSDFENAPFGVSGIETTVNSIYDSFIHKNIFSWDLLIKKYSSNPRKILGIPTVSITQGKEANFFIFDPNKESKITSNWHYSKSYSTPFLTKTLKGKIVNTVFKSSLYSW